MNKAMKKIFSLIIINLLISFSFAANIKGPVAQGDTKCSLGIYVIEKAGTLEMIEGNPLRTYYIRYENSPDSIVVAVEDNGDGTKRFLVISNNLIVEYINNNNYFGARTVGERFANEGFFTSEQRLDRQQYYHQKVITREQMSETDYLCLISVYYPKLIKDYSNIYAKQ